MSLLIEILRQPAAGTQQQHLPQSDDMFSFELERSTTMTSIRVWCRRMGRKLCPSRLSTPEISFKTVANTFKNDRKRRLEWPLACRPSRYNIAKHTVYACLTPSISEITRQAATLCL